MRGFYFGPYVNGRKAQNIDSADILFENSIEKRHYSQICYRRGCLYGLETIEYFDFVQLTTADAHIEEQLP